MKNKFQTNRDLGNSYRSLINITEIFTSIRQIAKTTLKIKKCILSCLFFISLVTTTRAQCTTYVQMVSGVEGCLFPVIVSTQQTLLPCSAPAGFFQLNDGDFAYIDYTPSSCITVCMAGLNVDITCFSSAVGIENREAINKIKIFPTLFQSQINIEGADITKIEIFNVCGTKIIELKNLNLPQIDLFHLSNGVYFLKVITKEQTEIKKIVKI